MQTILLVNKYWAPETPEPKISTLNAINSDNLWNFEFRLFYLCLNMHMDDEHSSMSSVSSYQIVYGCDFIFIENCMKNKSELFLFELILLILFVQIHVVYDQSDIW